MITRSTACITRVHSMPYMIHTVFLVAVHSLAGLLDLVTVQVGDCVRLCWLQKSRVERVILGRTQ